MLEQNTLEVPSTVADKAAADVTPPEVLLTPEALAAEPVKEPEDVGELYVQHRTLLLFIACRKFRIPENDAESLIQDVFLSFIQTGT